MKKYDLARIKIRELPEDQHEHLKDGRVLRFEVSVPRGLNGGRRFRCNYATMKEAERVQAKFLEKIMREGVGRPLDLSESAQRPPAAPPAGGPNLLDLVGFVLGKYARDGGVPQSRIDAIEYAVGIVRRKYGNPECNTFSVTMAENMFSAPPKTKSGKKRRKFAVGSIKRIASTLRNLWRFGAQFMLDALDRPLITFNVWEHFFEGRLDRSRGIVIYQDLRLPERKLQLMAKYRPDCVPAYLLVLHCALRPASDLAGAVSGKHLIESGRKPLTWGDVRTEPEPGFPNGYVVVRCYKTRRKGKGGLTRRLIPLGPKDQRTLRKYKPRFRDTDPVLSASLSAYQAAVQRCFREACLELYGVPAEKRPEWGDRDLARRTCISSWVAKVTRRGKWRHRLAEIARWAGHGIRSRTLQERYIGAMDGKAADRYADIGLPDDFDPPLAKRGCGEPWKAEEARRARAQGRRRSALARAVGQFIMSHITDPVTGEPRRLSAEDRRQLELLKLKFHEGPSQETGHSETLQREHSDHRPLDQPKENPCG